MARETRTTVTIASDLTGRTVDYPSGADAPKEVKLALNGKSRAIDLTADELAALETLIDTGDSSAWLKLARKAFTSGEPTVGKPGTHKGTTSAKTADPELTVIREWAKANGHEVADRGRIPKPVREAFRAAHSTASDPANEPANAPATADAA
jgi:hypothetical protein